MPRRVALDIGAVDPSAVLLGPAPGVEAALTSPRLGARPVRDAVEVRCPGDDVTAWPDHGFGTGPEAS